MVTIMIGYLDAYKCYTALCDRHSLAEADKKKYSKHIFIAFFPFTHSIRALSGVAAAYLNSACSHLLQQEKNEIMFDSILV